MLDTSVKNIEGLIQQFAKLARCKRQLLWRLLFSWGNLDEAKRVMIESVNWDR